MIVFAGRFDDMTRRSGSSAVTRAEVARLAGVSTAVVSYVVNGGPKRVSPDTAARVIVDGNFDVPILVAFLDCGDNELARRFSETRRRHPLAQPQQCRQA